ncbi:hypothetical protein PRK78_006263 [Emydomyces testavorans]|uniref:Uncharacterized protein n=1 Tax=Emydomyces testavorans TaxID=2070801 RepID=A0AAF0IKB5_9EURO|nr:hypothetical protein PRK78_006263 [Emydomyces testavorans]
MRSQPPIPQGVTGCDTGDDLDVVARQRKNGQLGECLRAASAQLEEHNKKRSIGAASKKSGIFSGVQYFKKPTFLGSLRGDMDD